MNGIDVDPKILEELSARMARRAQREVRIFSGRPIGPNSMAEHLDELSVKYARAASEQERR